MRGICRLCKEEKKLCHSHIIPEFFYKNIYDHYGRFYEISIDEDSRVNFEQKGAREYLFCEDCEQHLNKNERYVNQFFFGGKEIDMTIYDEYAVVHNADYKKFKLLQLSILWRASITSHSFFRHIDLGEEVEEQIQEMILDEEPGDPSYFGCNINMIKLPNGLDANFFTSPDIVKKDDKLAYRFVFSNMVWIFFDPESKIDESIEETFIKPNGKIIINQMEFQQLPFLTEFVKELKEAGKLEEVAKITKKEET